MTTLKARFAGLALIAALCAGFTLGLTAAAWAGLDEGWEALKRGDYATAMREFRPLAKQSHAKAQFFLGFMYKYGLGVPQDLAEAVKWYRKAAEQGFARAQSNLGFMYRKGHGVPQDYVRAYAWYDLAASRYPSGEDRDRAARNRDMITIWMTPAQISEAQKLAREWRPKK